VPSVQLWPSGALRVCAKGRGLTGVLAIYKMASASVYYVCIYTVCCWYTLTLVLCTV
jgi:hypothetical protein